MTDKELFEEVLARFQESYKAIKIEHPYNDSYMVFTINGKALGGLNPEGHNLLYCLCELTKIYEVELY